MIRKLVTFIIVTLIACISVNAETIVGWRHDPTGRFLDAEPPIEWSAENDVNIIWKTPMPSWSNASPLMVGNKIFVCSEPSTLICINADIGGILWERTNTYLDLLDPEEAEKVGKELEHVGLDQLTKDYRSTKGKLDRARNKLKKLPEDADPEEKSKLEQEIKELTQKYEEIEAKMKPYWDYVMPSTHDVNGYSSPTPVSDGEYVYVLYATGVAACYDLEGNRKWIKFIEKPTHGWGHSTTPILAGDKLLIHILDLVALDKSTGETLWQSKAQNGWGTGLVTQIGGEDILITAKGDFFRVSDGKQLAKEVSLLEYGRPIFHDDIIYFIQHEGKAFKLPDEITGDEINLEELWQTMPKKDRYYASSVYHESLIYAIVRRGHDFSVIDADTGEVIYEERLKLGKGETYPSITLAGEYLFVSNDNGTTVVMEPSREPKEIRRNDLESFRTSPLFVGDKIYIRGREHMYCIGE